MYVKLSNKTLFFYYNISKNKVLIFPKTSICKVLLCHAIICHALLFNIAKEKVANLYVLDEHLKQEKGKEKEISCKVLANHIPDKGLTVKIQKESLQFNREKQIS